MLAEVSKGQNTDDLADFAATTGSPEFDSTEAVVQAFTDALSTDDFEGFAHLLGLNAEKVKTNALWMGIYEWMRKHAVEKLEVNEVKGDRVIAIGAMSWPFPFPITRRNDGMWSFDTSAGFRELIKWRITQNELQVVPTLQGLIAAQREYATEDHDADGVLEYSQILVSDRSLRSGLYWPDNPDGSNNSPASNFISEAALFNAKRGGGYFGYRYRILTGQGNAAFGGAADYIVNGNMVNGFAFVASPANYGKTGILTFITSEEGVIYSRDFGPDTEAIFGSMKVFNPDEKWAVVNN
jgi:hypothetical protein